MKIPLVICSAILLFLSLPAWSAESWEPAYNQLLGKYVKGDGVDYASWKKNLEDQAKFAFVLESIANQGPKTQDREVQLAYYINAYNIWTLRSVLDSYPIKSVRDVAPSFGFFSQNRITVAGKTISLNDLEKQILIKQFGDPRIHFAINCASVSCPPLLRQAYTAAQLEQQLKQVTQNFIDRNPEAVKISNGTYALSSIFNWYADDFKSAGGSISFINQYRAEPIPETATITFQAYNWDLNKSR